MKSIILAKNVVRNSFLQWNSLSKRDWSEFLAMKEEYYRLALSYYSSNNDNFSDLESAWRIPDRYRKFFGGVGDIFVQILYSNKNSYGIRPPDKMEKAIIIVTAAIINVCYKFKIRKV